MKRFFLLAFATITLALQAQDTIVVADHHILNLIESYDTVVANECVEYAIVEGESAYYFTCLGVVNDVVDIINKYYSNIQPRSQSVTSATVFKCIDTNGNTLLILYYDRPNPRDITMSIMVYN